MPAEHPWRLWRAAPAIALAVAAALLVAGVLVVVYSERGYREQERYEATVQARILASTVTAALAFNDSETAQEYVDALQANPQIEAAVLYDLGGAPVASYLRPPLRAPPAEDGGDDRLSIRVPVVQGTTQLGWVRIVAEVEPLDRRITRYVLIALLVVMASLVVGVLGFAQAGQARANLELEARARDLSDANANLRVQIEERAKAEEALRQSQKMEAIGQLSGGMAHDFNNLLAAVLGNLELLRKRLPDGDPKARRFLEGAIQGAERGSALTQRLLAFARRQDLRPERVAVDRLVRGMAELLERSIGPRIRIETHFPIRLPPVMADANQLELALVNLAVNARDAMPEGGVVMISAREATVHPGDAGGLAPGAYLRLAVTDNGEGMDEATLARAMEPFFTTKGIGKGTGLGLSMVHGMAAQSGGRLLLLSTPGHGTTAEIWLPVAAAATPEAEAAALPEASAHETGPLNVLLVDDDALVRLGTAAMLEDLGHSVIEAASGPEALEALGHGLQVDLILTDQAMPIMLGTQFAALVRERWPAMPIILATGYAEPAPPGAPELPKLGKPFHQQALAAAIAQSVRGWR